MFMDTVRANKTVISTFSWRYHNCLLRNKGNVKTLQKSASLLNTTPSAHFQYSITQSELGYNVMARDRIFRTEEYNVMANSKELISLQTRCRINRCRYNRVRLYLQRNLYCVSCRSSLSSFLCSNGRRRGVFGNSCWGRYLSDGSDCILITNLMHWLLFIHKILFSCTCFEPHVLIFRRIQL